MKQYWLTICMAFLCYAIGFSQLSLPIRTIGGKNYYYRQVQKKETIYGIAKELGIPKEDIIKYNPSVAQGLKKDQILYFPVEAYAKAEKNQAVASEHKHLVQPGETLYGIAKMYGLSVSQLLNANEHARTGLQAGSTLTIPTTGDNARPYVVKEGDTLYRLSVNFGVELTDLLAVNPGVSPENFKAGMTILIPPAKVKEEETKPETIFVQDKVDKNDTFESLSQEYGVPEEKLKEANPQVTKLKKGDIVTVPVTRKEASSNQPSVEEAYQEVQDNITSTTINIALLLPLGDTNSKAMMRYREFYRGFMLGVKESQNINKKVHIAVYNTTNETIESVLKNEGVTSANVIFAPGEDDLLNRVAQFGEKNNINVVDAFSINNDTYFENKNLIHINTPSSYMYSAIKSHIEDEYSDWKIVFVDDGSTEEKPLIPYLKQSTLQQCTIQISELADYVCRHKTLFIPTTSSRTLLKEIKSAFEHLNTNTDNDGMFQLFGYPEWATYSEFSNFLKQEQVSIFSRYAIVANKSLEKQYTYWYGEGPINSVPRMYILGADLADYFLTTIAGNNNDFNKGLLLKDCRELCINLTRSSSWGGFVNTGSYIYTYTTKGMEKIILK